MLKLKRLLFALVACVLIVVNLTCVCVLAEASVDCTVKLKLSAEGNVEVTETLSFPGGEEPVFYVDCLNVAYEPVFTLLDSQGENVSFAADRTEELVVLTPEYSSEVPYTLTLQYTLENAVYTYSDCSLYDAVLSNGNIGSMDITLETAEGTFEDAVAYTNCGLYEVSVSGKVCRLVVTNIPSGNVCELRLLLDSSCVPDNRVVIDGERRESFLSSYRTQSTAVSDNVNATKYIHNIKEYSIVLIIVLVSITFLFFIVMVIFNLVHPDETFFKEDEVDKHGKKRRRRTLRMRLNRLVAVVGDGLRRLAVKLVAAFDRFILNWHEEHSAKTRRRREETHVRLEYQQFEASGTGLKPGDMPVRRALGSGHAGIAKATEIIYKGNEFAIGRFHGAALGRKLRTGADVYGMMPGEVGELVTEAEAQANVSEEAVAESVRRYSVDEECSLDSEPVVTGVVKPELKDAGIAAEPIEPGFTKSDEAELNPVKREYTQHTDAKVLEELRHVGTDMNALPRKKHWWRSRRTPISFNDLANVDNTPDSEKTADKRSIRAQKRATRRLRRLRRKHGIV